jgi:hypothetical protein
VQVRRKEGGKEIRVIGMTGSEQSSRQSHEYNKYNECNANDVLTVATKRRLYCYWGIGEWRKSPPDAQQYYLSILPPPTKATGVSPPYLAEIDAHSV